MKFLIAFSIRSPIWIIGGIIAYLMFTSPVFSKQQYGWLVAYTVVVLIYSPWVEIAENLITKALEDDEA
jgi:hypothetical protein